MPAMNALIFQLCVSAMAGWVNRGQQQVIEYLLEENRVLRRQLGGRRLRLTDTQRRRLAVRAEVLGRKALVGIACIVTPDTLLRWYRGVWSPGSTTEAAAGDQDGPRHRVRSPRSSSGWRRSNAGSGSVARSSTTTGKQRDSPWIQFPYKTGWCAGSMGAREG